MICLLILFLFFSCVSCTTSRIKNSTSIDYAQPTILSLPTQTQIALTYTDELVQADIENATPASLRRAVKRLYETSQGLSKEKHFSLTLAAQLMRILYPLESVAWNAPSYKEQNIYLDALKKIEKGLYPQLPNMENFFEAIIPAIILIKGTGAHEYGIGLENRLLAARALNPQSILPFYLLGLLHEQLNRLSDAEISYRIAWERDASCYPAGLRLARLLLYRNDMDKALEIAKNLYERYPQSISIQLLLAEAYIGIRDLDAAEELIYAILKKNINQREALFLRIRLHIEKKEYLPATALLDGYAKKTKIDKDYLLLRMQVLREWTKNTAEAKKCLEQAELLYPEATDVLLACAEFCFDTKDTINQKTASDFIAVLLQQGPRNILAIRLLVKQDIAEERWIDAFERAQYLCTNIPSDEHLILYTRACIGMKNWSEAVQTARTTYTAAQKPSNEVISIYLEALFGAKDFDTVKRMINEHLPEARSSLKSILLYYQAILEKNDGEKLELLRLSLLSDPRSVLTLFALYEWYLRHTDYRKAAYYLQQVVALYPDNKTYLALAEQLDTLMKNSRSSRL